MKMVIKKEMFEIILAEALDSIQKEKVDNFEVENDQGKDVHPEKARHPLVQKAIENVFDGKYRVRVPLKHEVQAHPEVEAHLNENGFKISDYLRGKATDKYDREVNIGRALSKSKAPKELLDKYAEHSEGARNSIGADDMEAVISHHPHDVAGMTSKGQSWEHESCLNFESGCNRHYIPEEIKAGTHVAYLVKKGHGITPEGHDTGDLTQVYGRIKVPPFIASNADPEAHVVFRPEKRQYGVKNDVFSHTVANWTDKKYPAEGGLTYRKDENVYSDYNSGKDEFISHTPTSITDKLDAGNGAIPDLEPKLLDHAVSHIENNPVRRGVAIDLLNSNQENISHSQVSRLTKHINLVRDGHMFSEGTLNRVPELADKIADAHLNDLDTGGLPNNVFKSPHLSSRYVKLANPGQVPFMHEKHIDHDVISKSIEDHKNSKLGAYSVATAFGLEHIMSTHPERLTKEHINKIADLPEEKFEGMGGVDFMANQPNYSHEAHQKLLMRISNPRRLVAASTHKVDNPAAVLNRYSALYTNSIDMVRHLTNKSNPETHDSLMNSYIDVHEKEGGGYLNINGLNISPDHLSEETKAKMKPISTKGTSTNKALSLLDVKNTADNISAYQRANGNDAHIHTEITRKMRDHMYTNLSKNYSPDHAHDKSDKDFADTDRTIDEIHKSLPDPSVWDRDVHQMKTELKQHHSDYRENRAFHGFQNQ
jgi:hypothetical protein